MKKQIALKAAREQLGKTQTQVAKELGISIRGYQNYEYGSNADAIQTAIRIAKMYNTTVEKLWSTQATL